MLKVNLARGVERHESGTSNRLAYLGIGVCFEHHLSKSRELGDGI
jgi:hypothetical protein